MILLNRELLHVYLIIIIIKTNS